MGRPASVSRSQRRVLAGDIDLRARIIAALKAGQSPADVARSMAALGVTSQRVWNIKTYLERLADRSHNHAIRMRDCLGCRQPFLSWGPGNRRCRTCSGTMDQAGPYEASFGGHARIRLR